MPNCAALLEPGREFFFCSWTTRRRARAGRHLTTAQPSFSRLALQILSSCGTRVQDTLRSVSSRKSRPACVTRRGQAAAGCSRKTGTAWVRSLKGLRCRPHRTAQGHSAKHVTVTCSTLCRTLHKTQTDSTTRHRKHVFLPNMALPDPQKCQNPKPGPIKHHVQKWVGLV